LWSFAAAMIVLAGAQWSARQELRRREDSIHPSTSDDIETSG
jgi:hypothetical protein